MTRLRFWKVARHERVQRHDELERVNVGRSSRRVCLAVSSEHGILIPGSFRGDKLASGVFRCMRVVAGSRSSDSKGRLNLVHHIEEGVSPVFVLGHGLLAVFLAGFVVHPHAELNFISQIPNLVKSGSMPGYSNSACILAG